RTMVGVRSAGVFLVIGLGFRLAACAPHSGSDPNSSSEAGGAFQGSGGKTSTGAKSSSGGASSVAGSNGTGENGGVPHIKDAGTSRPPADSSCGAVAEVPEQITKYIEASVTDTITTLTPVAIFIMQDRSSSMVTGRPAPASAMSWDNSANAITAFVK